MEKGKEKPPTISEQKRYFELVEIAEEKGWWLDMVNTTGGKYQLNATNPQETATMLFWTLEEVEKALEI